MKNYLKSIIAFVFILTFSMQPMLAAEEHGEENGEPIDVKELILEHLGDAYEWHITTINDNHITIPLPIILYSEISGFHCFSSAKFHHGHEAYNGFYIASDGNYKGKIVERSAIGEEVRPWDISITKNVAALFISSILLLFIIIGVANWYKKQKNEGVYKAPGGFIGFMEMFIMSVQDDIIKPCVGKNYQKFSPYLLTAFFFIFINNIMGLIPFFPGGANVTGNIAVTLVLGLCTFFIVNIFGTKEYWLEIINPDVPTWLKLPIPIMPAIEIVGIFTKPFALIIRLFANILAGHSIVLGLVCLIFVTASLSPVISGSMTFVSVLLTIFIDFVEILVAYIQAYVFTMLSAVFIGLAQIEPHHASKH